MALYFLKIDRYFCWIFIIRSFGDEFRSIFGDILSYLSSNIGNEGRLSTLLAILIIVEITFNVMSVNDFVISYQVYAIIRSLLFIPAMLFMNYKLFLVVRKSRRHKRISPDMKKTLSLKNISSCLLAVACVVVVSIPAFVYIGLRINSPETTYTLDNANLAWMWTITIMLMNSTFNCLIFYWKNKVLRTEGWKFLKSMKICRRVES
jgi:hypothetical protein